MSRDQENAERVARLLKMFLLEADPTSAHFEPRVDVQVIDRELFVNLEIAVAGKRYRAPAQLRLHNPRLPDGRPVNYVLIRVVEESFGYGQLRLVEAYFRELRYVADLDEFYQLLYEIAFEWRRSIREVLKLAATEVFGVAYGLEISKRRVFDVL